MRKIESSEFIGSVYRYRVLVNRFSMLKIIFNINFMIFAINHVGPLLADRGDIKVMSNSTGNGIFTEI